MSKHVLVLLVGTNPLPNVVTATYLLDCRRSADDEQKAPVPDHLVLVHSSLTEQPARAIVKQLELPATVEVGYVNLGEKQRNPMEVLDRLTKYLTAMSPFPKTLHLSYTGGTKPMAVFSVVSAVMLSDKVRLLLSDIDPDRFMLNVFDQRSGESFTLPFEGDSLLQRADLRPKVENIFHLHGIKVLRSGSSTPMVPSDVSLDDFFAEALAHIAKNGSATIFSKIENVRKWEWVPAGVPEELGGIFPSLASALKASSSGMLKFLQGAWLESAVLSAISRLRDTGAIMVGDVRMGVEGTVAGRSAEFDVIAMQGYRLFLITCTRSCSPKTVKQKAFEGIYRATQLGGEHAQVVVVSCLDEDGHGPNNVSQVQADLAQLDAARRCHLVGIGTLKTPARLDARLTEIFRLP